MTHDSQSHHTKLMGTSLCSFHFVLTVLTDHTQTDSIFFSAREDLVPDRYVKCPHKDGRSICSLSPQRGHVGYTHTHTTCVNTSNRGRSYCLSFVCTLTFCEGSHWFCARFSNRGPSTNRGPYCPYCPYCQRSTV